MRIAYLITRAEPIGGAQIHVRDLAIAMRDHGHEVTVLTGGEGSFVRALRAAGITTHVLRHLCVPIHPLDDIRALGEIRRVLATLRPDLVAAHSSKAGILGRIAGRSLRLPVVLTVHGWSFTPGTPSLSAALYRRIERAVGPLTTRIITVSEFDRRLALEAGIAGEQRLVTVHNGMPDVPPSLRGHPERSPARLVMVARLAPQKDHPTLLRALAGLTKYAWTLDLIGEGPLLGPTTDLARSLGLEDRVRFLGQRLDVDQLVAEAQVNLLVTNWEGFPLSILEAMRAGLPVVASDVGGVGESVTEGKTGYLVPRGGVEVLRDRIGRLLADADLRLRLGAGGRADFERRFTLEHTVARTLAVYENVLAEAS